MIRRMLLILLACAAGLLLPGMQSIDPVFRASLENLDPSMPEGYFELAEHVADVSDSTRERDLAIRLYALAATLDPDRWAHGSLLGIRVLLEGDQDRIRAVHALLELHDDARPSLLPRREVVLGAESTAAVKAFDVISCIRTGDSTRARSLLQHGSGVRDMLESYQDAVPGGMKRLLDRASARDGEVLLNEKEYIALLQIQSQLLGGTHETWAATMAVGLGQPLEDLSGAELGNVLKMDLEESSWRDGRWSRP